MKYASLNIERLAIHEIVRKIDRSAVPVLSTTESALEENQRAFIQRQIRGALGTYARPVLEMDDRDVPKLVKTYLEADDPDLMPLSIHLAKLLQACQPGISPAGIFLAADVTLAGSRGFLLAKLEHERGVRAEQRTSKGGDVSYVMQLLNDLLLTTASRVFKVALFHGHATGSRLSGEVVDRQAAGSGVAQYFLLDFLGCEFAQRADVQTQRFYDGTQAWINTLPDPEKKGRYEVALLSEMQANRSTISVDGFAATHLDLEDRDGFVSDLAGHGVPNRIFEKDVGLVKNTIKRLRIDTQTGVMILADPEALGDGTVVVEKADQDLDRVTVNDKVTKMSGHGRVSGGAAPPDGAPQ